MKITIDISNSQVEALRSNCGADLGTLQRAAQKAIDEQIPKPINVGSIVATVNANGEVTDTCLIGEVLFFDNITQIAFCRRESFLPDHAHAADGNAFTFTRKISYLKAI